MKKLGYLLLLLSVSLFSFGCTPAEDTKDKEPAGVGAGDTGTEDEAGDTMDTTDTADPGTTE